MMCELEIDRCFFNFYKLILKLYKFIVSNVVCTCPKVSK